MCSNEYERTCCSESPGKTDLLMVFDAVFETSFLIALCTLDM